MLTVTDRYATLVVNGKDLQVVVKGMNGFSRPKYHEIDVGQYGVVWVNKDVNIYDYVCEGSYDWGLPDGWFKNYLKEHDGERPEGVWHYPAGGEHRIFGYFLPRSTAILEFMFLVQKAHKEAAEDGIDL